MSVVPLFRCKSCGAAGLPVTLAFNGDDVGTLHACKACVHGTVATLDRIKPVFEAMVAAGIPRDLANETMIYLTSDPRFEEAAKGWREVIAQKETR